MIYCFGSRNCKEFYIGNRGLSDRPIWQLGLVRTYTVHEMSPGLVLGLVIVSVQTDSYSPAAKFDLFWY